MLPQLFRFLYFNFPLLLQGAIIIHEVYEEGAASKDGRLWAGDQILEVCKKIKTSITYDLDKNEEFQHESWGLKVHRMLKECDTAKQSEEK